MSEPFAVSVIIATRNRPELLRRALRAIADQTVPVAETIVVFDQSEPDPDLAREFPEARISTITNTSSPGLAGARNSGIAASSGTWIALCDDDDVWAADRLERQKRVVDADASVDFVVGGITIAYGDRRIDRITDLSIITFADLIRDRVMEAHPSTFLVRRRAIDDYIGLVDEELPGSYAEDYDWLLRASRVKPVHVAAGSVALVQWHPDSYFGSKWSMIDEALAFLLAKTPEFDGDPKGKARIVGQRAFAQAAMGKRSEAMTTAKEAVRLDWKQPRILMTLAVAARVVSAERLVKWANAVGRGF